MARVSDVLHLVDQLVDQTDFATVPLAMAVVAICHPPHRLVDFALIYSGALLWTFIEYWVHRALHMKRFPRLRALHMHHHQHPTAASGGTVYSTAIIVALAALGIACAPAAPVVLGVFLGYHVFILLHHAEHHGWPLHRGPFRWLAAAHDLHHHAGPNRAFGVTTTLWDRVFGTA